MTPERKPRTAPQVVGHVLASNAVDTIRTFEYSDAPPIQDALPRGPTRDETVRRASSLADSIGVSFREALLILLLKSGPEPNILRAVMRHNQPRLQTVHIGPDPVADLEALVAGRAAGRHVAIASEVQIGDRTAHIAMLDFRVPAGTEIGSRLAMEVLDALKAPPGSLLASGASFHFLSSLLVSSRELWTIVGKSLLFSPLIDQGWVAHQMIEGVCALRISPNAGGDWPLEVEQR